MKNKYYCLLLIIFSINSCQNNNFEMIYKQNLLTLLNCKNINFVKWCFLKETGFEIEQEIQVIITEYNGGIPIQTKDLPIYYEVKINEDQYNDYIRVILNGNDADSWKFLENNDKLFFRRITKFELSCTIDKNNIQFGFRMVEGIGP